MTEPTAFLWDAARPPPPAGSVQLRSQRWWTQFADAVSMGRGARRELEKSSREIVGLLPDPTNWENCKRPTRGLVVGAIQSGKTGHMMALAARALDQGYRIVIVLAGARDDLRTQTARRFNTQLLRKSEEISGTKLRTLPLECSIGALPAFSTPYHLDCHRYALLLPRLTSALAKGEPAVIVVKKNTASLGDLATRLRLIYETVESHELPLLILDDECDEASVDEGDRTIPEAIANLWRLREETPPVAYVGFTATAAANILQSADNDLYPDQFAYLLRFPAQGDSLLSFGEPNSDSWYSGTETFYESFRDGPGVHDNWPVLPLISETESANPSFSNESLVDALRAYLVAGAFRLASSENWSWEDAKRCPVPHSMLIQASTAVLEHGRWANAIADRFGGEGVAPGAFSLSWSKVKEDLDKSIEKWKKWYSEFSRSRERVYRERPHSQAQVQVDWSDVQDLLRDVVEHAIVKVVNSDPGASQGLDFAPRTHADGSAAWPQDVFVIVIGGSRLSRGITIEGLCVSYFCRWADAPTEDTVLQISRWFGYRGSHLEFCRLITTTAIAESLREIAANDRDLRFQLGSLMEQHLSPRDAAMILQCHATGVPTAKLGVGTIVNLAFSPHSSVFRLLEVGLMARANLDLAIDLVARIRSRAGETIRSMRGTARGELSRDWGTSEIASILDELAYERHNPEVDSIRPGVSYRPPDRSRAIASVLSVADDPYWVASYLRMWEADKGPTVPPRFNVGVVYGEMTESCEPFDFPLVNRFVSDRNVMEGGWGGRSASWRGDVLFDDPPAGVVVTGSSYRKRGAEGLLLMYVIHRLARGRSGGGVVRNLHSVTFGLVIPAGGPVHRRVLVPLAKSQK